MGQDTTYFVIFFVYDIIPFISGFGNIVAHWEAARLEGKLAPPHKTQVTALKDDVDDGLVERRAEGMEGTGPQVSL